MKSLLLLLITTLTAYAAKVEMENGAGTELRDAAGALLSAGEPIVGGDGDHLQLGYYDLATVATPFLGSFVALTGEGSRNGWWTSIGDGTPEPGRFNLGVFFLTGSPDRGNDLPTRLGVPLAIRFYDDPSIAQAQQFNAVSNTAGSWNWHDGINVTINMTLSDPGIVWQGSAASAFRTTLPVPEPGAGMLLVSGAIALARGRMLRP